MIIASAPGRAGIVGNPTDMYGGTVISCSTVERARVMLEEWDDLVLEMGDQTKVIRNRDDLILDEGDFDVAKAVIEFLQMENSRIKLSWETDIPMRAGLSGSTALLIAILNALLAYSNINYDLYRRAEIARHIELNYLKVVCGYQDAYMCTFGGLNYMDFREKEFYRSRGHEPYSTIESLVPHAAELPFVIAHTGTQRVSGSVHKPIRDRWLEGEPAVVQGYLRIAHLARIAKRALIENDWETLGDLMNENHEIQRNLGGSGEKNEELIGIALEYGAYGAKLAGAGRGGTIIILHIQPEEMVEALRKAGATRIMYPRPTDGVVIEKNQS